jgi:hypothetical protein
MGPPLALLPKELPAIAMLCPCNNVPDTPLIAGAAAESAPPPPPPPQAANAIEVSASKTTCLCLLSVLDFTITPRFNGQQREPSKDPWADHLALTNHGWAGHS